MIENEADRPTKLARALFDALASNAEESPFMFFDDGLRATIDGHFNLLKAAETFLAAARAESSSR